MHISEIIRSRRRELGMTQEQVAQRLGVSAPAVNKWERGICYPDITLIPSLARLFETDANTLLSFEPELGEEESLAIQREVDRLVREEGYEAGFDYAQEKMRLYPTSDELAIVLTQYLDGSLTLRQVADAEGYRPALDDAYARLAKSAVPAVRDQASAMLIAKAMQEERYEDAQRILDGIPDRTVDKEERQAILYAREGRDEDAARTWEARVIRIAADLMGAIVGLIEIALRDGRKDDALECARRAQLAFEALGQPVWMGLMPRLAAVTVAGDADEAIELLDAVMTSLHGGDSAALQGPLYRYSDLNDLTDLTSRMGALLLSEVENEDEYAFVRAVPAYRSFVEKWKAVGSV